MDEEADGVFPALVYVHQGPVRRRAMGYYDDQVVVCAVEKTALGWPIWGPTGQAEYEEVGRFRKRIVRVFHVDMDVPEFTLPMESVREQAVALRNEVVATATKAGKWDEQAAVHALVKKEAREDQAKRFSKAFAAGASPANIAQIHNRKSAEVLSRAVKVKVAALAIVCLVFGIVYGWIFADSFLPNSRDSMLGTLLPPVLMALALVMLSRDK